MIRAAVIALAAAALGGIFMAAVLTAIAADTAPDWDEDE